MTDIQKYKSVKTKRITLRHPFFFPFNPLHKDFLTFIRHQKYSGYTRVDLQIYAY